MDPKGTAAWEERETYCTEWREKNNNSSTNELETKTETRTERALEICRMYTRDTLKWIRYSQQDLNVFCRCYLIELHPTYDLVRVSFFWKFISYDLGLCALHSTECMRLDWIKEKAICSVKQLQMHSVYLQQDVECILNAAAASSAVAAVVQIGKHGQNSKSHWDRNILIKHYDALSSSSAGLNWIFQSYFIHRFDCETCSLLVYRFCYLLWPFFFNVSVMGIWWWALLSLHAIMLHFCWNVLRTLTSNMKLFSVRVISKLACKLIFSSRICLCDNLVIRKYLTELQVFDWFSIRVIKLPKCLSLYRTYLSRIADSRIFLSFL